MIYKKSEMGGNVVITIFKLLVLTVQNANIFNLLRNKTRKMSKTFK